ncbi:MAG: hypothetical protein K2Y29_09920 [Beijerinckiaceae bacterium]|nr:hypothetical protein [Beijerinckiaceae bacterium]
MTRYLFTAGLAGAIVATTLTTAAAQQPHDHVGHSHAGHAHGAHSHGKAAAKPVRKQATAPAKKGTPVKAEASTGHGHAAHAHEVHARRNHSTGGGAHGSHAHDAGREHGVETENLFGFVLGSDVEPKGTRSIAMETIGRFGKRSGAYNALGGKVEFAYGVTDSLSVAGAVLGAYYHVNDVPGFTNITRMRLNGLGGEVRWRLLNRETNGVGLTLHVEPVWATSDELTGLPGAKFGSENKIILDTMLVPESVYAAFNVIHEMEVVKEKGAPLTERAAKIGIGAAIASAVTKNVFIGAEARYLYAYDGLRFDAYAGRALYVGPTIHARFETGVWASLAWNAQVAGNEKGVAGKNDLTNFERQMVRFKIGYDF